MEYQTLKVTKNNNVATIYLNRPKNLNAMNKIFWIEFKECITAIGNDPDVGCVIVTSSSSNIFTAGLDLKDLPFLVKKGTKTVSIIDDAADAGRASLRLQKLVADLQDTFTAIEKCRVPVIAAINGPCIGGGVDLISACDMRYCTQNAVFSVKEVDLGLAADVGSLQRLPKIVSNQSALREWCFTGRNVDSKEALETNLVAKVFETNEQMQDFVAQLAHRISKKSPIAVLGTKHVLNHAKDYPTAESLAYVALWNSAMLQSRDLQEATQSALLKREPKYSKL